MTTREDFEKWFADSYGIDISIDRAGEGYIYDQINDKWIGYQSCAAHYEAVIAMYEAAKLYDEAPDDAEFEPSHPIFQLAQERDNYADQIRNLLALIAEKDKALRDAEERMTRARMILTNNNPTKNCNWGMLDTSGLIIEALSLTYGSVRLVPVKWQTYDHDDGKWFTFDAEEEAKEVWPDNNIRRQLYTIVKGE